MKSGYVCLVLSGIGIAGALLMANDATSESSPIAPTSDLRSAASFANIADRRARSVALFEEAGKVLQHPRCMNCHPVGDRPKQTDGRRLHIPLVVRGADTYGAPGMRCQTCHQSSNYNRAGVPGHKPWHLAPASMTWEGRSLGQICEQLKDRASNGDRDIAAIVKHVSEDGLVGWAWSPGSGRTPAPGTQAQLGELFGAWADAGAECPTP